MIEVLAKYVHIPFDDGTNGGMDCFEFASHFRKQEFNKETPLAVPKFEEAKNGLIDVFSDAISQNRYRMTHAPRDGDLVVMGRYFGKWHHVGIYFKGGVIHCTREGGNNSGVQFLPLSKIDRIFKRHAFYTDET